MTDGWPGFYRTDEEVWWQGIQNLAESKHWHRVAVTDLHNFMPEIGIVLGSWHSDTELDGHGAGYLSKLYLRQSPFNILVDFDAKKNLIQQSDITFAKSRLTKTKASYLYENGNAFYLAKLEDLLPWSVRSVSGSKS